MTNEKQEDMVLIQNILDGNHAAEETLYKKYKKIIKDYILSKYKYYFDIDDDVSEILIKIFLNINNFSENKSKFKSWVLSITKNYMIDKWRCTNTCNTTILPASPNVTLTLSCNYNNAPSFNSGITINGTNFVSTTGNLECGFSNSTSVNCFENCNAINYISSRLSPTDFTLLDMKYVQGYNYKEIGSEFQISSSTVSNKINYIKSKLKKSMPEDIFE